MNLNILNWTGLDEIAKTNNVESSSDKSPCAIPSINIYCKSTGVYKTNRAIP